MAEEELVIDPATEGRRIANKYLSELGAARETREQIMREGIPEVHKILKLHKVEEMQLEADEEFGSEVDKWRKENTKIAKALLAEVYRILGKRSDLTFFGKRIVHRLREIT
jgi:hypothetical protein